MKLVKYILLSMILVGGMAFAQAQESKASNEKVQKKSGVQLQAKPAPQKAQELRLNDQRTNLQVKPAPDATPTKVETPKVQQPAYMEKAATMEQTKVNFAAVKHDFGKIKQGDIAKHTFNFTNTGDKPLVLTRVKPSCGCTTPNWTREAIAPGESGTIDVAFNSGGKRGMQNKTVVVTGNFEERTIVLRFSGEVVVEPVAAPQPAREN